MWQADRFHDLIEMEGKRCMHAELNPNLKEGDMQKNSFFF